MSFNAAFQCTIYPQFVDHFALAFFQMWYTNNGNAIPPICHACQTVETTTISCTIS